MSIPYPETRRGDTVDDHHGVKVADPYRWLEAPDSEETRAWVAAQNQVTQGFLATIPGREAIRQRLEQLWDFERFGLPTRRGERYFYTRNDGLQNQAVLYVAERLDAEPRVLLDPNQLSPDGTVSLTSWRPSDDGRLLAFGLASAGSDWQEWKVLDVETGKLREDHIRWVKFSGAAWRRDGSGFYYSRFDAPREGEAYTAINYFHKLYFHQLGTPQSEDRLVYERPDEKEWSFSGYVTEDDRYLLIIVWRGSESKNLVFYQDLQQPDAPIVELLNEWEASYDFVGNQGTKFWFATDLDAPRERVIQIDLARPERDAWREIVPEEEHPLKSVSFVGDQLVCQYLRDVQTHVKLFTPAGQPAGELTLPGVGTAGGFGGRQRERETFYYFTNLTTPSTIFRYDFDTRESTVFRRPDVDFDGEKFTVKQVFYTSRDGTRVPMTIAHRRDLKLDGAHPTILYGYGGFNISQVPGFSVTSATWMEMGGVYAVANLRGGGEYGRAWHEAGKLDKKQNVFDDFIAAAEFLIAEKYTSPEKLAIRGGSNGGLLVAACMVQRPELFAAVLPSVGVLDMLRYHQFTIGRAWKVEYGAADDPQQFATLMKYSPLHNLRAGTKYPATLITTGDHDDRVVPAHSYKFAAELQRCQAGPAPALIRIETSAGHGGGKPTTKIIEETTDVLAFLTRILGMEPPAAR